MAENLFAQSDDDSWNIVLLQEIIDYRKDNAIAIPATSGSYTTETGQRRKVITTKGWEIKVLWSDQSTSWLPLPAVKESNPIELVEFAITTGIASEPAFNWWNHKTTRRRKQMIKRVKSQRIRKGRMKFGLQIPGTVEEALALDRANGNSL